MLKGPSIFPNPLWQSKRPLIWLVTRPSQVTLIVQRFYRWILNCSRKWTCSIFRPPRLSVGSHELRHRHPWIRSCNSCCELWSPIDYSEEGTTEQCSIPRTHLILARLGVPQRFHRTSKSDPAQFVLVYLRIVNCCPGAGLLDYIGYATDFGNVVQTDEFRDKRDLLTDLYLWNV